MSWALLVFSVVMVGAVVAREFRVADRAARASDELAERQHRARLEQDR
jgi:hypothetical protein